MYLKTHKTGSSSIQNCFFRYAYQHDLIVAVKLEPQNSSFTRDMVMDPGFFRTTLNQSYAMLLQHTIFNEKEVKAILPRDTVYITVIRSPVAQFESLYDFFLRGNPVCHVNESFSDFSDQVTREQRNHALVRESDCRFHTFGRNQNAFDLGMRPSDFDSEEAVDRFISFVGQRFDLVMITEKMDESTILMKHLLCWTTRDVVFLHLNQRIEKQAKQSLSEEQKTAILSINNVDARLYQHFSAKLEQAIDDFGRERMAEEVADLKKERTKLTDECISAVIHKKTELTENRVDWVYDFVVNENASDPLLCRLLVTDAANTWPQMRRNLVSRLLHACHSLPPSSRKMCVAEAKNIPVKFEMD